MSTYNQTTFNAQIGISASPALAGATLKLNSVAEWLAFSFTPDLSKTVNKFRAYLSALTGTPTNVNDFTCGIYGDSLNTPNIAGGALAGGSDQPMSAIPTAAGYLEFDGFSAAVSAGSPIWFVLKNPNTTDASPTTIYPTYQWITSAVPLAVAGSNNTNFGTLQSTNSGVSWTNRSTAIGVQAVYSDGTASGFPISGVVNDTNQIYNDGTSSHETGILLVAPTNAKINIKAVSICLGVRTAPTGPYVINIYEGASASACTLKATSEAVLASNISAAQLINFNFASPVTLNPSTTYRITIADTSGTGAATKYLATRYFQFDPAAPMMLLPFDGSQEYTSTPAGATSIGNSPVTAFTDDSSGKIVPCVLLLDTNGEFASTGGSSDISNKLIKTGNIGTY